MKYILFVGDGMADLPVRELSNMTVLEYTLCPVMSKLASAGEIGSVQTVPVSVSPGTASSFFSIMGYDPQSYFTGRGPLEAAGMGVELKENEVAMRCSLVNISDEVFDLARMGLYSSCVIDGEVGRVIMNWLINEPEFQQELSVLGMRIIPGDGFRHLAVLPDSHIFDIKEDFDIVPPHDISGKEIRNYINPRTNTNRLLWHLMRRSNEILKNCPYNQELRRMGYYEGNCIWLWGAGTKPQLDTLQNRYGVSGAVISGVPVVKGIGRLCGLTPINVEGATGDKNTNYQGKAMAAVDALINKGYDFALVHVAAPDECSHAGDIDGKIASVKSIDSMLETIVKGMGNEEFRILVMANHISSLESCTHDWGSVPYLIYDSRTYRERGISFDETSAKKYGGDVRQGTAILDRLFEISR